MDFSHDNRSLIKARLLRPGVSAMLFTPRIASKLAPTIAALFNPVSGRIYSIAL